jgi:hypothetical protein
MADSSGRVSLIAGDWSGSAISAADKITSAEIPVQWTGRVSLLAKNDGSIEMNASNGCKFTGQVVQTLFSMRGTAIGTGCADTAYNRKFTVLAIKKDGGVEINLSAVDEKSKIDERMPVVFEASLLPS